MMFVVLQTMRGHEQRHLAAQIRTRTKTWTRWIVPVKAIIIIININIIVTIATATSISSSCSHVTDAGKTSTVVVWKFRPDRQSWHSVSTAPSIPVVSSVVLLGLEMSLSTNFESFSLVLRVKSFVNSPGHLRATQTMTRRQLRPHVTVSLIALSLWHCLMKCLLHELVPPLSYFFVVSCSLAPRNLKRSLTWTCSDVKSLILALKLKSLLTTLVVSIVECFDWEKTIGFDSIHGNESTFRLYSIQFNSLTIRRPLLPYGYSYKASCIRPG